MAESVDALVSGTSKRKFVQVRVLFRALSMALNRLIMSHFYFCPVYEKCTMRKNALKKRWPHITYDRLS